jgi:hypothetical protein
MAIFLILARITGVSHLGPSARSLKVLKIPQVLVCKTPMSKITRAKWTGGVAQVVVLLLCSHEVLSSNTSPTKKKDSRY